MNPEENNYLSRLKPVIEVVNLETDEAAAAPIDLSMMSNHSSQQDLGAEEELELSQSGEGSEASSSSLPGYGVPENESDDLEVSADCDWYQPTPYPTLLKTHMVDQLVFEEDKQSVMNHTRSHLYTALGAVLHNQFNLIIWTDLSMDWLRLNESVIKVRTHRTYFGGRIRYNSYTYLAVSSDEDMNFGLSRTFQSRVISWPLSDEAKNGLEQLGIKAQIYKDMDWNYNAPFLVLELQYEKVIEERVRKNLIEFLTMNDEEAGMEEK